MSADAPNQGAGAAGQPGIGHVVDRNLPPPDTRSALAPPAPPPLVDAKAPTEDAKTAMASGDDDQVELAEVAARTAPPWLISAAIHMVVLIVMSLWVLPQAIKDRLQLESIWAESKGEQLIVDSPLAGSAKDRLETPIFTPQDLPEVRDPLAAPPKVDPLSPSLTGNVPLTSDISAARPGYALLGRQEGSRAALLGEYGGDATTEGAVQAGLKWLARNQLSDGSWSLSGPYRDGGDPENRSAATAMALLAFQGNGNTQAAGPYSKNVAKGWQWLLKRQDEKGNFFREGGYNQVFYTHGQATIAICELYAMTRDEKLREPAERAVDFCLRSQGRPGGWRYNPGEDSDVSVTGWILMGLQSARMAGLNVPKENLDRISKFLDTVAEQGGSRYAYQRGEGSSLAMTAEALLCRQYLGWQHYDKRLVEGVEWITEDANLIDYARDHNVYYWYYAAQVCHHMEGELWKRWNGRMRQEIPKHQVRDGREAGSWDPEDDQWATYGGRLYVTCLSLYCLEVYYRHLPLYSNAFSRLAP